MQNSDINLDILFKKLQDDINELNSSKSYFGYSERMLLERTLFAVLRTFCSKYLELDITGFTDYYKSLILENPVCESNSLINEIINQIFSLKYFLQKLSSENAYVRGDALSSVSIDKNQVFSFISIQTHAINKKISTVANML
jgi:hypothetical protein